MNDLVEAFHQIVLGKLFPERREAIAAIRSVLEHERAPIGDDYNELTTAFARVLFAWKFPGVLTSAFPMESHDVGIHDYFQHDPMAYQVLNALVHTAMMSRERWGMSEEDRKRKDARETARALQLMESVGLRPGELMAAPLKGPRR